MTNGDRNVHSHGVSIIVQKRHTVNKLTMLEIKEGDTLVIVAGLRWAWS